MRASFSLLLIDQSAYWATVGASPESRSAPAPLRGPVERLFNAGDCLPSSHVPSAARDLRYVVTQSELIRHHQKSSNDTIRRKPCVN